MNKSSLPEDLTAQLKTIRRRAITVPAGSVTLSHFEPGRTLPLVARPQVDGLDLAAWAAENAATVERHLLEGGAILFRGFGIDTPPTLETFARSVCEELWDENSEHQAVEDSGFVQTPVFYAPRNKLLWHNENSFNQSWPKRIIFCCAQPADEGGETPLVDSRRMFLRIDPTIRDRFVEKQILYKRTYSTELGLDWRTVFRTEDRAQVEAACRATDTAFAWRGDGQLTTRARRPAVVRHPDTGETSWFNQAQHWHPYCLDEATRASLENLLAAEDLPRDCFYGDGSKIEDSVMEEILGLYEELETSFPWQRGDVLLVDNILVAHARNPFRGDRRILVAMGDLAESLTL